MRIAAVSERTDRVFLPLEARSLAVTPASVLVDGLGSMKRDSKHGDVAAHFFVGPRDRADPAAPNASDLSIPRVLRPRLATLVADWTRGAVTTTDKLDAIETRFKSDFRYARAFSRVGGPDPAIDFLFGNRVGHCEYFATGMALVARAAGIPARFVAGYRVGEQSPFGYYVVRERNAHAWVEAWVPGRGTGRPGTRLPASSSRRTSNIARGTWRRSPTGSASPTTTRRTGSSAARWSKPRSLGPSASRSSCGSSRAASAAGARPP